jgi:UDP-glucose:(heptosyl)LPS alpha-1,3-glucosyltransferase
VERRTSELVKGLLSAGHDVHVYASRWDRKQVRQAHCRAVKGVTFHRVPMLKLGRAMKPLSFAWGCSALIPKSRHDLIHTQARIFRYDVATLGVGCHRAYLDAVGIDPDKTRDKWFHRAVLHIERSMLSPARLAAGAEIIVNSNMVKGELIGYYSVPEESIHVVHNGVDREAFSPEARTALRDEARSKLGLSPDEVAVLYVGAGFERKGLDTLISAIGSIGDLPCRLVIVGRGNRSPYMCALQREMIWAGESDGAGMARYYAAADIFALPTRYDPFANSTLEALASGLPVVTTTANGVSEILEDGVSGHIVKPSDPEMLADRIRTLAGSSRLREQMSTAGLRAVEPYTWQRTTEQTMAVYESIVSRKGKACRRSQQ